MGKIHLRNVKRELRLSALLFWPGLRYSSKTEDGIINFFSALFYKGRSHTKELSFREEYIKRHDNTYLRLCIYESKDKSPDRTLLWLHGGGFSLFSPETDEKSLIRPLSLSLNARVVSPDYKLSIKHPYPSGLYDSILTYEYLLNKEENIIIGGDSSGGNFALSTLLYLRDKGYRLPYYSILMYPALDNRPTPTSSHSNAPVLHTSNLKGVWNKYLNGRESDKYSVPALEDNFKGLPPTSIVVGSLDPLLYENEKLYEKLIKDGVRAKMLKIEGAFHGFNILSPKAESSKEAISFIKENMPSLKKD